MARFAVKRLAAVEVEPTASHQHELNAGTLRSGLGFPEGRTEGELSILCYGDPGADPVVLEGDYTLYDARERHRSRSEYRLYYRLPGLDEAARPDDLLVLCRSGGGTNLQGVIARPGTRMERQLEGLLRLGDHASLRRLIVRDALPAAGLGVEEWVGSLLSDAEAPSLTEAVLKHPVFAGAVQRRAAPATKVMAEAGRDIARQVWGGGLNADAFITRGLEAESDLYFAIEKQVGTRALHDMLDAGPVELDIMLAWALKIQQSRKSRRGQSLQHHFGFLLDREGVPYTPQCQTEGKERPDFVVPGHAAYHDSRFPAERLRMVACKSTVRERWAQILKEADRIPEKYLLTLDGTMSADVIRTMHQLGLRVYVPVGCRSPDYGPSKVASLLGSVSQLVHDLRLVV